MTRLMALDVGSVRIGVAVSDATGFLASPYTTLHVAPAEEQTFAAIQQLISEIEAEGIVVGLPISLDGQIHAQGERIQAFAERLPAATERVPSGEKTQLGPRSLKLFRRNVAGDRMTQTP